MTPSPEPFGLAGKRIWVAGHRGMLGAALLRRLASVDCTVLTASRERLDLRDGGAVKAWVEANRPQAVLLAAGRVGGIAANIATPATFLFDNLMILANVVDAAHGGGVERLVSVGSSAVYPVDAAQPMAEGALMTGPVDPAHEGYAAAKLAGIALTRTYARQHGCAFLTVLPTNLYGPGGNFDPATSHVVAGLVRKVHEAVVANAAEVVMWGSGRARREFLHVDDCADACCFLLARGSPDDPVNLGSGEDVPIREVLERLCEIAGFRGRIVADTSKPEGAQRRLMDSGRLAALGWRPRIGLRQGLADTYRWFAEHHAAPIGDALS